MTLMHMMNAYKLLTKTVVDLPLYDIFYVIVLLKKQTTSSALALRNL